MYVNEYQPTHFNALRAIVASPNPIKIPQQILDTHTDTQTPYIDYSRCARGTHLLSIYARKTEWQCHAQTRDTHAFKHTQ